MNYVQSAVDEFQGVFPFSVFFGIENIVASSTTSYSTSSLTLTYTFPNANLSNSTGTISILTPTTLQDRFGATAVNWWYNIILMLATVLLAWGIFKVIYHPH